MYYIFFGEAYYPSGGIDDYQGQAVTLEDAIALAQTLAAQVTFPRQVDWIQIVESTPEGLVSRRYAEVRGTGRDSRPLCFTWHEG